MQETPRLLFVHAHPDDETITNGATIAHYVARGAQVQVVTCTLGEEGEVIGDRWAQLAVDHADQLGGYRIGELTAALRALGSTGRSTSAAPAAGATRAWSAHRGARPAAVQSTPTSAKPSARSSTIIRDAAAARRGDLRPQRWLRASRPHSDPRRHHRGGRGRGRHVATIPGSRGRCRSSTGRSSRAVRSPRAGRRSAPAICATDGWCRRTDGDFGFGTRLPRRRDRRRRSTIRTRCRRRWRRCARTPPSSPSGRPAGRCALSNNLALPDRRAGALRSGRRRRRRSRRARLGDRSARRTRPSPR